MRLFENIHLRNLSSLQEQVVDEEAPTEEGLGLQMPKVQGLPENVDKVYIRAQFYMKSLLYEYFIEEVLLKLIFETIYIYCEYPLLVTAWWQCMTAMSPMNAKRSTTPSFVRRWAFRFL